MTFATAHGRPTKTHKCTAGRSAILLTMGILTWVCFACIKHLLVTLDGLASLYILKKQEVVREVKLCKRKDVLQ